MPTIFTSTKVCLTHSGPSGEPTLGQFGPLGTCVQQLVMLTEFGLAIYSIAEIVHDLFSPIVRQWSSHKGVCRSFP